MMLKGQHEAIVLTLTDLSMLSGSKNEARELSTVGLRSSGQRQNKSNASDMKTESLTYGAYYHIYNRGNNSCDLFREEENYKHFLDLYDRYMNPVAETYAWVLMLYPVKYF
ncbi:hypothetical protein [Mangrovibacterium marinum]|nr:hypothetical protein [Mangrovibacterium marinum]